jgi:hypothetical protein
VDDNVIPIDRIRRYRVQVDRREVALHLAKAARFCLEASTVLTILGRALQFSARELGYSNRESRPSRIRIPFDYGD